MHLQAMKNDLQDQVYNLKLIAKNCARCSQMQKAFEERRIKDN